MIRLLVVEDQYEKIQSLSEVIKDERIECISVQSILQAQQELLKERADILLLDIHIPDELGSSINPKGGIQLLEWIEVNDSCIKPMRIIIATSQEQTYETYKEKLEVKGIPLVFFKIGQTKLQNVVFYACQYEISRSKQAKKRNFDIVILTALSHNELREVLELPANWSKFTLVNDPTEYYAGSIRTKAGMKSIVTTHCPRMGLTASSSMTLKLCANFNPQIVMMCGIAAGIEGKVNIGDVLIADPSWDWGNGKLTVEAKEQIFKPSPHQVPIDSTIRTKMQRISNVSGYLFEAYQDCKYAKPSSVPIVKIGPLASGAVVLEDPDTLNIIVKQHRETIGIEMEAYGVMAAVKNFRSPPPLVIIAKSVCDFANTDKNDNWQDYASYMSARFLLKFINEELFMSNDMNDYE